MDCRSGLVVSMCWVIMFLTSLPQSQCDSDCKEYNCGTLSRISGPFWGEKREAACGGSHPLELTCNDDGDTTIRIGSQNFTVKRIDMKAKTMTLVRTDLLRDVCYPKYEDTYVNPSRFGYPPYNITIFYNCSDIRCGYAYPSEEDPENLFKYLPDLRSCTERVRVPANESLHNYYYGPPGENHDDLIKVLDGFEVTYNLHNDKLNLGTKIIIGVVCLVVGVLVGIGIYFLVRRRKSRLAMSYIQSRSLSSDPSSKDTEKGIRSFTQSFAHGVPLFSYDELEEATNYFDSSKELGEGGFGTVYFGKLRDGRSVAVKRLYENNYKRVEQFMNEIKILAKLVHPNLVTLYGCTSRHSRELLLVYEYIPNGTVSDHLHGQRYKPGKFPWHIRMNIAVETASALKFLHLRDIIHRDVKTNNILLDSNFHVKVADFGLSRLFPEHVTHVSTAPQGTPGYVDPEYHECYQLTNKSDVFSFGVVLVELISSLPAVDITRHRHEINLSNMAINKIHGQALHELVDPTLGFESDFKVKKMINAVAELAFQCLQSSKEMRPSMEEVEETLKDIQSDGKHNKSQPEVMDITSTADDVVLLKDDPPPPSPDSNAVSKSTTPNASG